MDQKAIFQMQYLANGQSVYSAHNYAVHTGKMIARCKRRETYRLSACNDLLGLRSKNDLSTYTNHVRVQIRRGFELEKRDPDP
jgi:hypothetical protein